MKRKTDEIKVSVIIPVYNAGTKLKKCIESVLRQTLTDIEVICIDDASEDESLSILREYMQIDDRIILIENEKNEGQGYSRNKGVEKATGKYIQFVDADDYISENMLETYYFLAQECDLDVLKTELYVVKYGEIFTQKNIRVMQGRVYTGNKLVCELVRRNILGYGSVQIFINREYVKEKQIRYAEGILHEDVLYTYDVLSCADRVMYYGEPMYYYVLDGQSSTRKKDKSKNYFDYLFIIDQILKRQKDAQMTFYYLLRVMQSAKAVWKSSKTAIMVDALPDELRTLHNYVIGEQYIDNEMLISNLEEIRKCKNILLYGAGAAANEFLLESQRYDLVINDVFVTDLEQSPKTILGHKVKSIEQSFYESENTIFLIAISAKYVGTVEELLRNKGYTNIVNLGKR